jgi:hypothetical protein
MLAPDPADRPASMGEVRDALKAEAAPPAPAAAARPARPARASRAARPKRSPVAAILVVILTLLLMGAVFALAKLGGIEFIRSGLRAAENPPAAGAGSHSGGDDGSAPTSSTPD